MLCLNQNVIEKITMAKEALQAQHKGLLMKMQLLTTMRIILFTK